MTDQERITQLEARIATLEARLATVERTPAVIPHVPYLPSMPYPSPLFNPPFVVTCDASALTQN